MWWINKKKGQASLVMILLIGFVAIASAIASSSLLVANVQIEETIHDVDQAWFAAWAGVDELMYRLRVGQNFGAAYTTNLTLGGGATVSATITGDASQKTVQATGYAAGIVKRLEVNAIFSSSKSSFAFAVQAGEGGFELLNNSYVTGVDGSDGNVYSNGDIRGITPSSGSSGSRILGNAWAVGFIGGLNSPSSGGVYVKKNATTGSFLACKVDGAGISPIPPSNCQITGGFTLGDGPQPAPLVDMDVDYWKGVAEDAMIWNGNCGLGGGGQDCTGGTRRLGNIKILGNLTVTNNQTITITGPVWVVGDIYISNNVVINMDDGLGANSVMMIASDPANPAVKGQIEVSNNIDFNRNASGAGIIMVSENTSVVCSNPAIDVENNTDTVIFVAQEGCIFIGNNAVIIGVAGKKIHLENNSIVRNDPTLLSKPILVGGGGWAVLSVREY